jgi:hypothetical protein
MGTKYPYAMLTMLPRRPQLERSPEWVRKPRALSRALALVKDVKGVLSAGRR